MKKFLKSALLKVGVTARFTKHEPKGVDFFHDISNLPYDVSIKTIFDVGANIGNMSEKFARTFPGSEIYAFEPISRTYETLCRNVGNQLNIKCNHCAFGSAPGKLSVEIQDASVSNSLNKISTANNRCEQVTITTIDDFTLENRIPNIDILKIDTEGYDLEVLKGAEKTLHNGNVVFIFAECTFYRADMDHTYFFDIKEYLENLDYDFFALYDLNHIPGNPTKLHYCNAAFVKNGVFGKMKAR